MDRWLERDAIDIRQRCGQGHRTCYFADLIARRVREVELRLGVARDQSAALAAQVIVAELHADDAVALPSHDAVELAMSGNRQSDVFTDEDRLIDAKPRTAGRDVRDTAGELAAHGLERCRPDNTLARMLAAIFPIPLPASEAHGSFLAVGTLARCGCVWYSLSGRAKVRRHMHLGSHHGAIRDTALFRGRRR